MNDPRSRLGADLAIKAARAQVRFIRKNSPRPFGFDPESGCPLPVYITSAHGKGTVSSLISGLAGLKTPIWTMSLGYGDASDASAAYIEVASDFHLDVQESRDVEDKLIAAIERDKIDPLSRAEYVLPEEHATEVSESSVEITIRNCRRLVPILRTDNYSALQFTDDGVLVTVTIRNFNLDFPEFIRLTDLEPMLEAMERLSRDDIAAWFAASRNR